MLRIFTSVLVIALAIAGCKEDVPEMATYTGNEISYSLFSASEIGTAGNVTFRERTDGSVDVLVTLDENYNGKYPVHLHYGDLSEADAPQATLLSDYNGEFNRSLTTISVLADESEFTFDRVKDFNGSVKIHLAGNGPDYDVIISAGNIGSNVSKGFNIQGVASCGDEISF